MLALIKKAVGFVYFFLAKIYGEIYKEKYYKLYKLPCELIGQITKQCIF